jgi:hypothetical protein
MAVEPDTHAQTARSDMYDAGELSGSPLPGYRRLVYHRRTATVHIGWRTIPLWTSHKGRSSYDAMCGYVWAVGGTNVSLMVRGETQRMRLCQEPALSFVPLARAPPKGCCPTTAPVGLSLM